MKVLSVGKITYDYSLPIDGFPIEGLTYELKEKVENAGGGASDVAYLLAKWNEESYLSAAVGGDELGTKLRKDMEEAGVKVQTMETVYEGKTPISFILINKNDGNKTIFSICEKEPHLKKYEFDFTPDIIYLDGYEYTSGIAIVNKFANAITVLGAKQYDKQTVELCKYAKYIIATQDFAESLSGVKADFNNPTTLLEMYKKVATKYINSVLVITLKDHGAIYLDNNQIKVMPGIKGVEVKDSTGAGDIFRGAFVAGLARAYDIEKTIRIANISAGLSLSKIGSKESVPLFSDVAAYYEKKFGSIDAPSNGAQEQTPAAEVQQTATTEQTPVETTQVSKTQPVEQTVPEQKNEQPTGEQANENSTQEVSQN